MTFWAFRILGYKELYNYGHNSLMPRRKSLQNEFSFEGQITENLPIIYRLHILT
jgi:hypothetical protein